MGGSIKLAKLFIQEKPTKLTRVVLELCSALWLSNFQYYHHLSIQWAFARDPSPIKARLDTKPIIQPRRVTSKPFHSIMAPKQLNFITGNKNKLIETEAILGGTVDLQSKSIDLVEIQGTIEEITADKCRRAAVAVVISTLTFPANS